VADGYLAYQACDSVQGLCSYLRGVVATSAVLSAAGVGDAGATALSAAAAWALRDGTGMVGGLVFSYAASAHFDGHVKEFRLFADVINDVGLTLDMLAPYAGAAGGRRRVLYVSSLATICKTMCGMAAGATKGSIAQHFALRGNMADLTAKESTQETLVSLVGMICGVGLARYLHALEKQQQQQQQQADCDDAGANGTDQEECSIGGGNAAQCISWIIFISLTILHVWANYRGVKLLKLRTLNRERAEVALQNVVDECARRCGDVLDGNGAATVDLSDDAERLLEAISAPDDVSESLWSSASKLFFPGGVHLGARVGDAFQGMDPGEIAETVRIFVAERYIITPQHCGRRGMVSVVLCAGSTEEDQLKAFVHALVLSALCKRSPGPLSDDDRRHEYVLATYRCICQLFARSDHTSVSSPAGLSLGWLQKQGWETNRLYLGFGQHRAQINDERKKKD